VIYKNLKNEAMTRVGLQRHRKKKVKDQENTKVQFCIFQS